MQKMAKLQYAEEMLRMQLQGFSVRKIAHEINRRLKLSKKFRLEEDGEAVQLSKTTIADFLKQYKEKRKNNDHRN